MPTTLTCIKCGNTFKVSEVITWTYTDWCDHCMNNDQPRSNEDKRALRGDARDEFNEDSKERNESMRSDNV